MKIKIPAVCFAALISALYALTALTGTTGKAVPSDLRDAVVDKGAAEQLGVKEGGGSVPGLDIIPFYAGAGSRQEAAGNAPAAAAPSPKIYVTPVTSAWKDTMLVKFSKGADIDTVKYVLESVGLTSSSFADNGAGFLVRIDIGDSGAPDRAAALARYAAVEGVQVNKAVYALLSGRMRGGLGGPAIYVNDLGCTVEVETRAGGYVLYIRDEKRQQAVLGVLADFTGGNIASFCGPAGVERVGDMLTLSCAAQAETGAYPTRGLARIEMLNGVSSVQVVGEVKKTLGWKTDTNILCDGLRKR